MLVISGRDSAKGTRKIQAFSVPSTFSNGKLQNVPSQLGISRVNIMIWGLIPNVSKPASLISARILFSKLRACSKT